MKRLLFILVIILFALSDANAQGWVNSLGNKAKEKAKEKVEQKVEEKTEEVVEKGFETVEKGVKKKKGVKNEEEEEGVSEEGEQADERSAEKRSENRSVAPQQKKALESFTQYDFIPGDKILFMRISRRMLLGIFRLSGHQMEAERLRQLAFQRVNGCISMEKTLFTVI
jgi:hypothetical protein